MTKKALKVELDLLRAKIRRYLAMTPDEVERAYRADFPYGDLLLLEDRRRTLIMSAIYLIDNVFDL
jgi:hypothetical protein